MVFPSSFFIRLYKLRQSPKRFFYARHLQYITVGVVFTVFLFLSRSIQAHPHSHSHSSEDPCAGYPTPPPSASLTSSRPPTLFFLHIPKTAGTLVYKLLLSYANRTNGLSCSYNFDGNRHAPSHYQLVNTPPASHFAAGSVEAAALIPEQDLSARLQHLARGACRIVRGHITTSVLDVFENPPITVTVLREPLHRFVSMYEFVRSMVRARPNQTGWDEWVAANSLADEIANSSSIFHRGFYDASGVWRARNNEGFSFHFYGVLHQLSGITPRFQGELDPKNFGIANAAQMAEKAKSNLCSMHVIGFQEDMNKTISQILTLTQPWAKWRTAEKKAYVTSVLNKTPGRVSMKVEDHLPAPMKQEIERRLEHEIEVYDFAKRLVAYREVHGRGW